MKNLIELYEAIKEAFNSVVRSRLQMIILLSLGDGEKTLADFRSYTSSSSQALIPNIRRLETDNLIIRNRAHYALTPLGLCFREKIVQCVTWLSVIHDSGRFWKDHYLEGIPLQYLHEINDLQGSSLISNCNTGLFLTFSRHSEIISSARYIHRLTSVFSPLHIDLIRKRVQAGIPVEVLVDRAVAGELYDGSYLSVMKDLHDYSNFTCRISHEHLFLCLTVTDGQFALGMYQDADLYDSNHLLVSSSEGARNWGERVFSYYWERSEEVLLPDTAEKISHPLS